MSGNTSETRCKHCQRRIAFSGNYWLQVETNGYLSGGFCLSNPNGRHEPTPPEGEAVTEPVTGLPLANEGENNGKDWRLQITQGSASAAADKFGGNHEDENHGMPPMPSQGSNEEGPEVGRRADGDKSMPVLQIREGDFSGIVAAPVVSTAAPEPPLSTNDAIEMKLKEWAEAADPVAPESYKPAEGPKWNEILLKFREYRLWMHEQVNWLANKWQQRGDVECREEMLDLLRIEPDAATPVTVEAPSSDIARQIAICEENGTKWAHFKVAEIKQLLATPKPIGDVEAVAGKLYGQLAYVDIGMVDWLKKAAAILRPLFAPAGPEKEKK